MKSARVVFRVARGVEVRVSQGICGLFESCPVLSAGPLYALLSTLLANGSDQSSVWVI
jgi:hypothetical protein